MLEGGKAAGKDYDVVDNCRWSGTIKQRRANKNLVFLGASFGGLSVADSNRHQLLEACWFHSSSNTQFHSQSFYCYLHSFNWKLRFAWLKGLEIIVVESVSGVLRLVRGLTQDSFRLEKGHSIFMNTSNNSIVLSGSHLRSMVLEPNFRKYFMQWVICTFLLFSCSSSEDLFLWNLQCTISCVNCFVICFLLKCERWECICKTTGTSCKFGCKLPTRFWQITFRDWLQIMLQEERWTI